MTPNDPVWDTLARTLRRWYCLYLACWLGGIALFFIGIAIEKSIGAYALMILGGILFVGSVVVYVICMVYAYQVQAALNSAGLYDPAAWQIIVAAVILNPAILGFYVPLRVLLVIRRIRQDAGMW
jgi:hypothetical protein